VHQVDLVAVLPLVGNAVLGEQRGGGASDAVRGAGDDGDPPVRRGFMPSDPNVLSS